MPTCLICFDVFKDTVALKFRKGHSPEEPTRSLAFTHLFENFKNKEHTSYINIVYEYAS